MRRVPAGLWLALSLLPLGAAAQPAAAGEVVVEVRIHGNYSIPDADVLALAGVAPGDPIGPDTPEEIAARLRDSGRFDAVEVRKRYTSLSRGEEVALILLVTERPGASGAPPVLRTFSRLSRQTLVMPLLRYDEGLGVTYGVRLRLVDVVGEGGALAVPLTLGGRREAALELEKRIETGPVDVLRGRVAAFRVENQHYRIHDRRTTVAAGVERALPASVRLSADAELSDVRFGLADDRVGRVRVGIELDTRRDVGFPRNAVFVRAGWRWLDTAAAGPVVDRGELDARGFAGLVGQTVLAVRAHYLGASGPLPPYEQPLLGGVGSVRGHRVGARAGDRLALASAELRVPVSSPMSFGRAGLRVFFDTGAVYAAGQSIRKARFSRGAGVGLFLSAAIFSLQLDIAHDTRDDTRVHVTTAVSF